MSTEHRPVDTDGPLRPHSFDGIQEYDKRLPNWWLWTLYGAIAFSLVYWAYYHAWNLGKDPVYALQKRMQENTVLAQRNAGVISDDILWAMSRDPKVVEAGRATYSTQCATCHLPDLAGAIGPNLKDHVWIHGNTPMQVVALINKGVLEKGMPTWGPVLGANKINEVTAFIMSFHQPPTTASAAPSPVAGP
jgi:cytochrome c oxidase cbb3-type subunit 3